MQRSLHCTALVICVFASLLYVCQASSASEARNILKDLLALHTDLSGPSKAISRQILRAYRNNRIPPIIHQTWKDHNLPTQYKIWSESWSRVNAGWLHVIWSDEENNRLVRQLYPSFAPTYNALPLNICRADAVRPLILHQFGGIYADLDSEGLRPIAELLEGEKLVLGQMGSDPDFAHSIPNAFMASAVDQQFWMFFIHVIQQNAARLGSRATNVENIAGPVALKNAVKAYQSVSNQKKQGSNITLLPPGVVFPIDWSAKKSGAVPSICDWRGHQAVFNSFECIRRFFPRAYSVQWWTHGWA